MSFFSSPSRPRNDAYATPPKVVQALCDALRGLVNPQSEAARSKGEHWTVVDPSAGDGRIGLAAAAALRTVVRGKITVLLVEKHRTTGAHASARNLRREGVAVKRIRCDFLRWSRFSQAELAEQKNGKTPAGRCICVGNPPFSLPGVARNGVVRFAEHAAGRFVQANLLVFVVPLSMRAQKNQNKMPPTARLVRDVMFQPREVPFAVQAETRGTPVAVRHLRVGVQAWQMCKSPQRRPALGKVKDFAKYPVKLPMTTRPQFLAALQSGRVPHALVRCKGNQGEVGVKWWSQEKDARAFEAELRRMSEAGGKGLFNFWVHLRGGSETLPWFSALVERRAHHIAEKTRDVSVGNAMCLTRAEFLHLLLQGEEWEGK